MKARERQLWLALGGLCVLVYLPLAGCYGLWDPWETHYSEIARQILVRHDWISLWWPCSPIDRPEVFHKPVLHFWLLALSMKLFGIVGKGAPDQLVRSFRVEWAVRLPNIVLSIVAILATAKLVEKLASRRAAALTAVVLLTSSEWALVSRQAMTDLSFVAPMTVALALAGIALLGNADEMEAALPRLQLGRCGFSVPHSGAFYAFVALYLLTAVPQLVMISSELRLVLRIGASRVVLAGVVPMLPYLALFFVGLWWCARANSRREIYLFCAWVLCALASLAKGPAGIGLPAIAIGLYLIASGRWRELARIEIVRGALLFVVCAFPWYHAMTIRHGMAFWNELIGDNYIHRALGRSGDRGMFDYYLTWIGYGMFPWSGLVALAGLRALRPTDDSPRARLVRFSLVWAVSDYAVVTLVVTRFHHYILPALPALAILAGLLLDELCERFTRALGYGLLLVSLPLTFLCGRDLAALPARVLWMFDYDYVVAPRVGRPWPSPAVYGDRFEFGARILTFTVLAALGVLALALARRRRRWILSGLGALAIAWTLFVTDGMIRPLSAHWSQKRVIAAYYAERHGASEPLVAWELYWRGESFYTQNEIYRSPDPGERTVFLPRDRPVERLTRFLDRHRDRRIFFLVERERFSGLRAVLPEPMRETLRIVNESNNKLYLAVAETQGASSTRAFGKSPASAASASSTWIACRPSSP